MIPPDVRLLTTYKPASFIERGVAVPFTTPHLAGARMRPAARTGTEFVVPNPSGGRGVYVLAWGGVRQMCRPTVHDTLLHQRIARLPAMNPGTVRVAARQLAAEGLAGHEASVAATASIQADQGEQVLVNFLLLVMLMEQVEPIGLRISADTERTPELDRRARRIVTRVAGSLGRDVADVSADLERLSLLLLPIGLDAETLRARLPRLADRLESIADELATWPKRNAEDGNTALVSSLSRSAAITARCADASIRAARALTTDIPDLLRLWNGDAAGIIAHAGRAEWILDGWERFCLLWDTVSDPSGQRAILREMAQLVPMLPLEADEHGQERVELERLEPALRAAQLNANWRSGWASQGLIARNERLRGMSV